MEGVFEKEARGTKAKIRTFSVAVRYFLLSYYNHRMALKVLLKALRRVPIPGWDILMQYNRAMTKH